MLDNPIAVVGSLIADIVIQVSRWPSPGETMFGEQLDLFPGGKGLNQAIAIARQGVGVTFVGQVGDDVFGHTLREAIRAERLSDELVFTAVAEGSGVGIPFVFPNGENAIVLLPRANMALSTDHILQARPALESARILLLQLEIPDHAARLAASIVAGQGGTVILDPAPFRSLDDELMSHVRILTPNQTELETMAGNRIGSADDIKVASRTVLKRYPSLQALIATMGDQGAMITTADSSVWIAAHKVNAIDSTAAGDAFNGVLATRLLKGESLETAGRYACVAGALAATRLGAVPSLPTFSEVESACTQMGVGQHGAVY